MIDRNKHVPSEDCQCNPDTRVIEGKIHYYHRDPEGNILTDLYGQEFLSALRKTGL